ncbi:MAG: hypothetical protein DMG11_12785, partial [Acidobacteria bacterium]
VLCELSKVNAEKLESLLPHSQCLPLQAAQQDNIAQRYSDYALACFERIQAILPVAAVYDRRGSRLDDVRRSQTAATVSKALVQIVIADHQEQVLLAGLLGLLKTAALENPQFIGQLILATPEITTEELAKHLQEEKSRGLDPLIKCEHGARQALRWQEVAAEAEKPPIAFKDNGVYLITGGLGGLGVLFAKEILEQTHGARVVLTGRSALTEEKQALLDGLSAQSERVSYRQLDLGDVDQVHQLIAAIKNEYGQLTGILHSAGMIADHFILNKTNTNSARCSRRKSPVRTTWTSPPGTLSWISSCCFRPSLGRWGIWGKPITRRRMVSWTSLRRIAIGKWPQKNGTGARGRSIGRCGKPAGWVSIRRARNCCNKPPACSPCGRRPAWRPSIAVWRCPTTRQWSWKVISRRYAAFCLTAPRCRPNRKWNNRWPLPRSMRRALQRRHRSTCASNFRDC